MESEELVGDAEAEVECMDGRGLPEGMTKEAISGSEQLLCWMGSGGLELVIDARKEMLDKLIRVSGKGLTTDEKQSIQDCVVDAHDIFVVRAGTWRGWRDNAWDWHKR